MADERDPNVSQRYRELGGEEPPPAVDQAVLRAARQAVSPRRRWYVPLAAAAVLVLAVGVALQVQHEQPEPQPSAVEQEKAQVPAPGLRKERKREQEDTARDSAASARAKRREESRPAPAAAPPIPRTAPVPPAAPGQPSGMVAGGALAEAPEQWLERIADLRARGRDEEADKAFAEFTQRYPDYRIPDEVLKRIRK